ncbi:hypothetical protein DV451_002846 [Geotrichum candidum]|uniref:chitin synthase n=1 Tax=Geotrichum candidum TaxID=1173061 RepID=A0A9P5G671_GEOCN|nr:hypothetical protein DV451_002846 [Geotrichum candidum]KAF5105241.1 hypothetical protein DV453_005021 [Geotrichum candidum]
MPHREWPTTNTNKLLADNDPSSLNRLQYDQYQFQQSQQRRQHEQQQQEQQQQPQQSFPDQYNQTPHTNYTPMPQHQPPQPTYQSQQNPYSFGQQSYNPYGNSQNLGHAANPPVNNVYNHYPVNDVDSDFYEVPGVVNSNSNLHPHQSPRPHHEVTHDPSYTNLPEEPNSYLLENLNKTGYVQSTSLHDLPRPQPPHHGGVVSNFYHGYNNDSQSFAVEDIDNFQPFPVAGDSYALNTYQDDSESYTDDNDSGTFSPNNATAPIVAGTFRGTSPAINNDDNITVDQTQPPPPPPTDDQYLNLTQPIIPPPEDHQARRVTNTKKVRLFKGNLVLDCPVPSQFLSSFNPEDVKEREFTHMRYSAATCDPDQFVEQNFLLRQKCYRQPRSTELLIAITVYNEDDILLGRTLAGVFKNIKHLIMRNNTNVWGQEAWKKVVVCVIADGRSKMDDRAKGLMARLGVYQEGLAKNLVADRPVHAHIYEYTTMAGIKSVDKIVNFTSNKTVPVQMIFCMKEKNQKKINSHRWFFNAFGRILQPKVCILLDAGTQPAHDSIYHLWKSFDTNPRIGGACGEIRAGLGKAGNKLINPLVAAQNFEYKMSNILDKPMESMFGFITVLPGAFSAYRYDALQNNEMGDGPLNKYFKGETLHNSQAGLFTANMYLAEDRILCFELVAKKNSSWLLKYVKSAHAVTDVPETLSELVLQRRRWLNGSFFAAIYSLTHVHHLWKSSHSFLRKLILLIEFLYQLISILFSWFSIGNFFLVFRILTNSLGDPAMGFAPGKVLGTVFLWLYCACIVSIFVLSFGNRPKGTQAFYIVVVIFFAVLMAYLLFAAIYISVKSVTYTLCVNNNQLTVSLIFGNELFRDLVVSLLSTYALYFVSSFLFFEPWHMFTCFLQYLLVSPSYINVLNVYAFCNIHDISWGTKGDTGQSLDLGVAKLDDTNNQQIQVAIPHHLKDIDENYTKYVTLLNVPKTDAESQEKVSEQEKEKDYYALIRSSVVLTWMFTNFVIIAVVLNTAGLSVIDGSSTDTDANSATANAITNMLSRRNIESVGGYIYELTELVTRQVTTAADSCGDIGSGGTVRTEIYLTVVLWCVAALAAFRFVGAVLYIVLRLFGY